MPPELGNTCVYEIELEPSVALVSVVHKNKSSAWVEPSDTKINCPAISDIISNSGSLEAAPDATTIYKPFWDAVDWSFNKTLFPVTNVTPSNVSPFSNPLEILTFAVDATLAITLVLSPATKVST